MGQNRSIDRALKQPRRFEVLVPFTVFPYSELTLNTVYFLWKVYQGKILTLQVWKPKSSWTMTVRFCSRYPLGHRTRKNIHMKKVLCSPLPFACTLARKWGLVETKQNRGVLPAYHIERSVFQLSLTKDIERSGTLYKKARMEQNRSIDPSRLKQPRRFLRFGSFYCGISLFWVNSRYWEKCTKEKYQLFKSGSLNHLEPWLFDFVVDILWDIELTSTHTCEKSSVFAFVGWLHWTLPFEKV